MNNVNDDEKYIMEVFLNLMNQIGYSNLFVFGDDESSRYSIYKDENNWILREKDDWGIEESYYTNLYNLCFSLIKRVHENKKRDLCLRLFQNNVIIPDGTEVLIFNQIKGCDLDNKKYIKGKIIGQKESEKRFKRGIPWCDKLYIVRGSDNEYYIGKYGSAIEGYYFKTIEDYITHIFEIIEGNCKKINDLNSENNEYRKMLSDIVIKRNDDLYTKKK